MRTEQSTRDDPAQIGEPPAQRISYRFGVNLGDVIFDDGDVFGDGVNVAARLQALAVPGGVCVSDIVHQTLGERLRTGFRDLGSQRVKNISRPIKVWQWSPEPGNDNETLNELATHQRVRFVTSPDNTQIAWASIGKGWPILKAPNWLNHLNMSGAALPGGRFWANWLATTGSFGSTKEEMGCPIGTLRDLGRRHAGRHASRCRGGRSRQLRIAWDFARKRVLDPLRR